MEYDNLRLCEVCEDAYTLGRLCSACSRQEQIDNDDLSLYSDEEIAQWIDEELDS